MHKKVNFAIVSIVLLFTAALMADTMPQKGDDPDASPPVIKADLKIVQRAREILSDPSKWNRADTRKCPDDAKTFSLYCSLEKATREVTGGVPTSRCGDAGGTLRNRRDCPKPPEVPPSADGL